MVRLAVGEQQSIEDLVLAQGDTVAYALVVDKPAAARRADVPAYITGSSYPELLPGRTHVGDAQDARRLVAVDLSAKSETTVSLSAETDPRAGPLLWSLPVVSTDGSHAATIVVSSDNKHRYVVSLGPTPGTTRDRRAPAGHRLGARPRRVRPAADHDGLRAGHREALVPVRARRLDAPLPRQSGGTGHDAEAAHQRRLGDHRRPAHARRPAVPDRVERGGRRGSSGLRAAGRGWHPHPADGGARRARNRTVTGRGDVGAAVVVREPAARSVPGTGAQGGRHGRPPRSILRPSCR